MRRIGTGVLMRRFTLVLLFPVLFLQAPVAVPDARVDFTADPEKVVLVDFWASWCVPCRRSFPWYNAMHDKYHARGLLIVAVNLDTERVAAEEFLAEFRPRFEVIYDETKELARRFEVIAMPSSYLIGRDGEILMRHFGFMVRKQEEYEAAIVAALGELE